MASKKTRKTSSKSKSNKKSGDVSGRKSVRRSGEGWWLGYRVPIILLAITALAMFPVVLNDFISIDDEQFITGNAVVQNADVDGALTKQLYSPHYKPLVYLSWITEVAIFGNNPYVLHANNLILHLISTLLVFFCAARISRFWDITKEHTVSIAFFTALLFGIHPLHVESVAWAIERKDVLFCAFYLGGLLSYLKYLQESKQKYLYFTALFYLLSMLSKSMGVTLIPVAFLMDFASGRRDWKQCLIEKWPLYIPAVIGLYVYGFLYTPKKSTGGGGLAEGAIRPPGNIEVLPGFYQKVVIAAFRYLFFFVHTIIPAKLAVVYPRSAMLAWPGQLIHLALLGVGGIAALPWIFKRYRNLLLTGLLFFTIAIVPILIEEGPGTNFGSDRYTYLPSIGLLFLISTFCLSGLKRSVGKFSLGQVALAIYCLVLGVSTFIQAGKWGDSITLYTQAINNYKRNSVALHYRGGAREDVDPAGALKDYDASIEIDPDRWRPLFARGTLFLKMGRNNEAIEDLTRTLQLKRDYPKAWVNRGNAYRDLGAFDEAISDYNEALKLWSGFDKALNNRGAAYLRKGMYDEALADFNRVLQKDPAYVNGYINRAALYINSNVRKYSEAIEDYNTALSLEPGNTQAIYFRGVALRAQGRYEDAVKDFDRAIELSPNNGQYYYTRALALRNLNRIEESVNDARKAQSLGHNVPQEYLQ